MWTDKRRGNQAGLWRVSLTFLIILLFSSLILFLLLLSHHLHQHHHHHHHEPVTQFSSSYFSFSPSPFSFSYVFHLFLSDQHVYTISRHFYIYYEWHIHNSRIQSNVLEVSSSSLRCRLLEERAVRWAGSDGSSRAACSRMHSSIHGCCRRVGTAGQRPCTVLALMDM
ncbi:hypothetical protein IWX90DRAFT_307842 [Phyllosticta citrichinensis]|uniref:Uncharacterized protein n=1 Tax=Phyllosticta citrichinensis TaxID=1130410 RepID=A0ABR1XLR1_9PEZI